MPEEEEDPPDLSTDGQNTDENYTFFNITWNRPSGDDYIFHRPDVFALMITLYTFVFLSILIGNSLEMLVVIRHKRMRNPTNFFLVNLSVADFSVGFLCVYQNMTIYLYPDWNLGNAMCKLYHFAHSLSYTASVLILIVIAMERYFAIIHPMRTRQLFTKFRQRLVCAFVWLLSAAICCPRFIMYGTTEFPTSQGETETICHLQRSFYDSKIYDLVNSCVSFLMPLCIIVCMYTVVIRELRESSEMSQYYANLSFPPRSTPVARSRANSSSSQSNGCCKNCKSRDCEESNNAAALNRNNLGPFDTVVHDAQSSSNRKSSCNHTCDIHPTSSTKDGKRSVFESRRKAIRLLVTMVFVFAICHLPFHARKLWQNYSSSYDGTSNSSVMLTVATTLILYLNSGINPFLYAILSERFRECLVDICCQRQNLLIGRVDTKSHRNEMNSFTVRSISISQEDVRI